MDLTPTPLQADNYAKEQQFLEALYTIMEVGKEQEMSRRLIQQVTQAEPERVHQVLLALQRANAYTMRFEWHDPNDPLKPGKHSFWTLQVPYDTAKAVLDKAQQDHTLMMKNRYKNASRTRALTIARVTGTEDKTVYTTGDDMPKGIGIKSFSPADKQPKALIEAARMYGPKLNAAKQAFETLTANGIEIDEAAFFELTKVPKDERLEIVSLVLPYIDQLELQVKELKAERRAAAKVTA